MPVFKQLCLFIIILERNPNPLKFHTPRFTSLEASNPRYLSLTPGLTTRLPAGQSTQVDDVVQSRRTMQVQLCDQTFAGSVAFIGLKNLRAAQDPVNSGP